MICDSIKSPVLGTARGKATRGRVRDLVDGDGEDQQSETSTEYVEVTGS
jgi:hypothetical protein